MRQLLGIVIEPVLNALGHFGVVEITLVAIGKNGARPVVASDYHPSRLLGIVEHIIGCRSTFSLQCRRTLWHVHIEKPASNGAGLALGNRGGTHYV